MAARWNRETFFPSTYQGQNLLQPLHVCLREAAIKEPCSVASCMTGLNCMTDSQRKVFPRFFKIIISFTSHLPSSSPDSDDESGRKRWKEFHREPGSKWISSPTFLNYPSKADAGLPQVTALSQLIAQTLPFLLTPLTEWYQAHSTWKLPFLSDAPSHLQTLRAFCVSTCCWRAQEKSLPWQPHVTSDVQPRMGQADGTLLWGSPCITPTSVEWCISHRLAENLLKPLPEGSYRS